MDPYTISVCFAFMLGIGVGTVFGSYLEARRRDAAIDWNGADIETADTEDSQPPAYQLPPRSDRKGTT